MCIIEYLTLLLIYIKPSLLTSFSRKGGNFASNKQQKLLILTAIGHGSSPAETSPLSVPYFNLLL